MPQCPYDHWKQEGKMWNVLLVTLSPNNLVPIMEAPGRSFVLRRPDPDGDATTSYLKGIVQQRIKYERKKKETPQCSRA